MKNSIGRIFTFASILGLVSIAPTSRVQAQTEANASASSNQPADEAVTLNPFEVSASSNVGYGAATVASSSRLAQAYIDVPQTVNVITSEMMQDFDLYDTVSALQSIPNIVFGAQDNGALTLRGVNATAMYIDGVAVYSFEGQQTQPTAFYDRIEVVKGPSSSAFSVGEPGGIINYISKTPSGVNQTDISVGYGEYNNYRATIDTQGVSPTVNGLSYRVNMLYEDGDYIQPMFHHQAFGAEIALRYDYDKNTSVQLIVGYTRSIDPGATEVNAVWNNLTGWEVQWALMGKPANLNLLDRGLEPPNIWAVPSGQYRENDPFTTEVVADHRFNDHFEVHNSFLYEHIYLDQLDITQGGFFNPSPGIYQTGIVAYQNDGTADSRADDLDFLVRYDFLGAHFQTLFGGVFSDDVEKFKQLTYNPVNAQGTPLLENLFDPNYAPVNYGSQPGILSQYTSGDDYDYGWYIEETGAFLDNRILLQVGGREDYYSGQGENFYVHYTNPLVNTKVMPNIGITLKPLKWLSVYGLYTQHKDPPSQTLKYTYTGEKPTAAEALSAYGLGDVGDFEAYETYQPSGTLHEAGVKTSFFDGKLTVSACAFHMVNGGQILEQAFYPEIVNPDGTQTAIVESYVTSQIIRGAEVELFGQLARRLQLYATYGVARGTSPTAAVNGVVQPTSQVDPPATVDFKLKYDFGDLRGNGFYVTGGDQLWGPHWAFEAPWVYYSTWQYSADIGAGYKWANGRQKVSFTCTNFTQQDDIVGVQGSFFYQAPRRQWFLTYDRRF